LSMRPAVQKRGCRPAEPCWDCPQWRKRLRYCEDPPDNLRVQFLLDQPAKAPDYFASDLARNSFGVQLVSRLKNLLKCVAS
jgi:hypothetical protein